MGCPEFSNILAVVYEDYEYFNGQGKCERDEDVACSSERRHSWREYAEVVC
jgi:hypothetical protein